MANVNSLALTDDEAAAVAVHANGAWRTPLPTVDESDVADLAFAILRGRRSLVIRELGEPDGTITGDAAEVLTRLGTGPCAAFMLVDADGNWLPSGPTVYLYGPAPDQVKMSHVVAAAGVHYFRVTPPPQQWRALTELAEAVFQDGFTAAENGAQQPAAALLSVIGAAGLRSVRVACGEASAAAGHEPVAFTSVAQAADWLQST
jgi:hypothetical protein